MIEEYKSGAVNPVESISEGWNLVKNDYGMFVLMSLILGIIVIIVALILGFIENTISYAIFSAAGIVAGENEVAATSGAIAAQLIAMSLSFITNILLYTLIGVLLCGIYQSLSRTADGQGADLSDLFSGFDKLTACFIFSVFFNGIQFLFGIILVLIAGAIGISFYGIGSIVGADGQINTAILSGIIGFVAVFVLVSLIFTVLINALTTFIYPLISQREMSGLDALTLCVKSCFANLGGIILLLILQGLIVLGGFLVICIGILFVAPILFGSTFAAFRSVFGKVKSSFEHIPPPPPNFGNQPSF